MPNSSDVPGALTSHHEETLEVIRRILKEVPLIDGWVLESTRIRKKLFNYAMFESQKFFALSGKILLLIIGVILLRHATNV